MCLHKKIEISTLVPSRHEKINELNSSAKKERKALKGTYDNHDEDVD
jgi:hypothetical protein